MKVTECSQCRREIPEGELWFAYPFLVCMRCDSLLHGELPKVQAQRSPTERQRSVVVTSANPDLSGTYYHADDHPLRDRAPDTPRRQAAVQMLIDLGYTWQNGSWRSSRKAGIDSSNPPPARNWQVIRELRRKHGYTD